MEYKAFESLDTEAAWYISMCALHDLIFPSQSSDSIKVELTVRPQFLILVALEHERVVGYKIGYQDRNNRFYSWFGGVNRDYRGRGIASELMVRQHEWYEKKGYKVVQTKTRNKWRSMLILNLRHGFDIVGTYTDEGEPRIILEKRFLHTK
jgi:ribosomal protein S18 acetylase RimI-like enzyme